MLHNVKVYEKSCINYSVKCLQLGKGLTHMHTITLGMHFNNYKILIKAI